MLRSPTTPAVETATWLPRQTGLRGIGWGAAPDWFDPEDTRLRWRPPELVSPVTLTVPTGFYQSAVQADDQDLIVEMPTSIRNANSDMEVRGGRNIHLIGGHARGRITFKDFTGHLYIEGLEMDLSGAANKDALNVYGKAGIHPTLTIQNSRITGLQGTSAGVHADILQVTSGGGLGDIRIDKLTGDSNYQGLFLRPEYWMGSAKLSRINLAFNALGTPEGSTYLYWFRNMTTDAAAPGDPLYPIDLIDVYAQASTGVPGRAAAWPPPGTASQGEPTPEAYAGVVDGSGNMSWPSGSGITGQVQLGTPADYVAAADVGISYVAASDWQEPAA